MEVVNKGLFPILPAADGILGQAIQPVSSWPFEFQWEVFDGVEVVSPGHVDVENKVFNPNRRVRRSIICLDVYGFKPFWKIVFQYLIGEAKGVCGTPVSGCVVDWVRQLRCAVFVPRW